MAEILPAHQVRVLRSVLVALACTLVLTFSFEAYAQPVKLKPIPTNSKNFTTVDGQLYFSAGDALYTSNGTASETRLVKAIGEQIIHISKHSAGGFIFFVTQAGDVQSLWKTDGSANTTKVTTQISVMPLLVYKSELYLRIFSATTGAELWKWNASGLSIVKDINPGTGSGLQANPIISNNLLYFTAQTATSASDLWKSDGTSAGTVLAVDLDEPRYNQADWYGLTDVNGTIFFTRNYENDEWGERYAELWKTKGTEASTSLVKLWTDGYTYNYLNHMLSFKGKLYFFKNTGDPQYHNLFVSDGTAAGTIDLRNVSIDGASRKLINAGSHLVYYAESQSFLTPIEKYDGTTFETVHEFSYMHSAPDGYISLTSNDSLVFFVDHVEDYTYPDSQFQLWQSDLNSDQTQPMRELYNISLVNSRNVVAAGESIFFTTLPSSIEMYLWYYDPNAPAPCEGTGFVLREQWNNVTGGSVSQIPVNTTPDHAEQLTSFQGPSNAGDNYGSRYKAYLCVPQTGDYRFSIASNDHSELWLSTSMDPSNKTKIAYVTGYTLPKQYNKYTSQRSSPIHLVAGQLYYIEALHKEGVGTDHLSVAMTLPDGQFEDPIPGSRLIPFNNPPVIAITSPENDEIFSSPANVQIDVSATDTDGTIQKVEFFRFGMKIGEDITAPYSYTDVNPPQGSQSYSAKAIDNKGAETMSDYVTVHIRNVCTASGTITREVWYGVQGSQVSQIPTSTPPHEVTELSIFEAPSNMGTNYGARMRGYICPPETGYYLFYISSNDQSELWLSSDSDPANKVKIAYVTGATGIQQWNKYSSQMSVSVWLVANRRYYIEALHKQGVGSDNLAVGWKLPSQVFERPIPGSRLSPFESSSATMAQSVSAEAMRAEAPELNVSLSPNPTQTGKVSLTLDEFSSDEGMKVSSMELNIVSSMGKVMYSGPVNCDGACETVALDITQDYSPGIYVVNGVINGRKFSKRLLVK